MSFQTCPKCGHLTLSYDARCQSWLCHIIAPRCNYSESQDDHDRRLGVPPPDVPHPPFGSAVSSKSELYELCPLCRGTKQAPHAVMNAIDCPCTRSPNPGFAKVGLTMGQVERMQEVSARDLNAMWEACRNPDPVAALETVEARVRGREAAVYHARRTIALPEVAIRDLGVPRQSDRPAPYPPPPAPEPTDVAALRLDRDRLLCHLWAVMGTRPLSRNPADGEVLRYARQCLAGRGRDVDEARVRVTAADAGQPAVPPASTEELVGLIGLYQEDRDRLIVALDDVLNPTHYAGGVSVVDHARLREARALIDGRGDVVAMARVRLGLTHAGDEPGTFVRES